MKRTVPWLVLIFAPYFTPGAYAESVYEWAGALTLESVSNLDGGLKQGSRQLANLDLTLAVNTEAAGWWGNGEWFVYVLGDTGQNPSDYVGDLQGISNIATDESLKLYEFWYQHQFADEHISVLFGLHDYNSTFYSLASAGLFTTSSFGIGADTSQVGPSIFSTTSTALHLTFSGEHLYLLAAVYDGIAGDPNNPRGTHIQFNSGDGLFSAAEWGWTDDDNNKIALGVWQHTAEVESPVDGAFSDNNSGIYLIAEKNINDVAAVFVQLGQADADVNQLEYYGGTGITFSDFWKEGDSLGLAVAHARNGDPYLLQHNIVHSSEVERAETAWEFTYFAPFTDQLSAQASVYYIQHPAMDKSLDAAVALGARVYIEF